MSFVWVWPRLVNCAVNKAWLDRRIEFSQNAPSRLSKSNSDAAPLYMARVPGMRFTGFFHVDADAFGTDWWASLSGIMAARWWEMATILVISTSHPPNLGCFSKEIVAFFYSKRVFEAHVGALGPGVDDIRPQPWNAGYACQRGPHSQRDVNNATATWLACALTHFDCHLSCNAFPGFCLFYRYRYFLIECGIFETGALLFCKICQLPVSTKATFFIIKVRININGGTNLALM